MSQRDRLRRDVRHGTLDLFAALNAVGLLRVSKQGELIGLDVDQHGITAYPEYEIGGEAAHVAMSPDMG